MYQPIHRKVQAFIEVITSYGKRIAMFAAYFSCRKRKFDTLGDCLKYLARPCVPCVKTLESQVQKESFCISFHFSSRRLEDIG